MSHCIAGLPASPCSWTLSQHRTSIVFAKFGLAMLFAIATCTMWVRELPSFEGEASHNASGASVLSRSSSERRSWSGEVAWRKSILRRQRLVEPPDIAAGRATSSVWSCSAVHDASRRRRRPGVCRPVHDSRGRGRVRHASIEIGTDAHAGPGSYLRGSCARPGKCGHPPIRVRSAARPEVVAPLTLVFKVVLLTSMVAAFSATLSRGLSKSLEQSVRAIFGNSTR